jgi:L-rhamnose mutarotase
LQKDKDKKPDARGLISSIFLYLIRNTNPAQMPELSLVKTFGSLIGLREEAVSQYILLHRHTFQPVLDRIARSNIANYSIFLLDGILFGIYDYLGQDYEKDMAAIGEDQDTQQWWKLTEPLQEPLPSRKQGEWWAGMSHLYSYSNPGRNERPAVRKAFKLISVLKNETLESEELRAMMPENTARLEVFIQGREIYFYAEIPEHPHS